MGFIGSFVRLLIALVIFVGVLILGVVFSPQLASLFNNLPGTLKIQNGGSTVEIPILASIAVSLVLTVVLNLIMLPFRRRSAET